MAIGYEDLDDRDSLRRDPMMAVGVGKADPLRLDAGGRRRRQIEKSGSGFLSGKLLGNSQ